MFEDLRDKIERAPSKPGVYLFKGRKGPVYIGKAKDLKKRLQQHLKAIEKDPKERAIFKDSIDIEWIVTRNEYEALTLEIDLIQSHKPKYNVLHKHGGGYPLLVITDEPFPTVKVVRGNSQEGEVFGPFLQAGKAYKVKKLIHRLFKLRTCDPLPVRKEPCMDYHLGLCSGPCCGLISEEEYRLNVEGAKALLSGDTGDILPKLYERIETLSKEMMFEKCAQIRDQIRALENVARGQTVSGLPFKSADLFYLMGNLIGLFLIRGGKVVGKEIFDLEDEAQVEEFLAGFYYSNPVPDVILTNFAVSKVLRTWISSRNEKVSFSQEIPENLKNLAEENLKEDIPLDVLEREFSVKLGIPMPDIIEGFDISHFQGSAMVGSCVVWEKGRMNKKLYRRYRVKTVSGIDDYSALKEILRRRARRIISGEVKYPDIWLIDGGKGQLNVALEVKEEFGLKVRIFALAKEEETLISENYEELSLKKEPILYRVFGQIRDEAHRFALAYNRKLRSKEVLDDILSKIKGIGEVRKKVIYRNFDTIFDILQASDEELKRLGLPTTLKEEISKYLSKNA